MAEMVEPNTCFRGCCSSEGICLHFPPSSYSILSTIARGSESTVFKERLQGRRVVAKKPVLSTSEDLDKFHRELQLLCKLDHPGLTKLVGAHSRPPNYMFFFEFYEMGSLAHKLHVEEWSPSAEAALVFAYDLANTLKYMHELGVVHRDVKPGNILLDSKFRPHLTDFGLASYMKDLQQVSLENWKSSGVVPYTDLRAEAQAHTVLEMRYTQEQLTTAVVSEGLQPALAQLRCGLPESLIALVQRCWDSNPVFRPSFKDITKELDEILKDVIKTQGVLSSKKAHDGIKSTKLWPSSLHEPLQYRPTLSWGSFAACGRREKMEDTHFLLPQMCNEKDIHVFGIFDGHRGAAAAEFSARALPGFLKRSGYTSSPWKALCESFVNTDIAFRKELTSHCNSKRVTQKDWHPGCTALTSLIVGNKLFVANAGDCRAILCRSGHPFPTSKEHLASCLEERTRVIKEGIEVTWQVDTWRVGPAALQVTRSIGDDNLKPAVTAEPEIIETCLSAIDEFLVMASDGLWDVMSNEEVISIIRDTVKEATMCCKRLATEAVERGSRDNISHCCLPSTRIHC